MDKFTEILEHNKSLDILERPKEMQVSFENEEKVLDALQDIILNERKVLVYGDYDADGGYFRQSIVDTFDAVGFKGYKCFPYRERTHQIDSSAVSMAISEKFEYIIIGDAGSSSPNIINYLRNYGVKVILLDHHDSKYDYADFGDIAMINVSFDNRRNKEDILVSAGALGAIICLKLCKKLGIPEIEGLYTLAVASMYADVVDMSSTIARYMYYRAMEVSPIKQPKLIQRFQDERVNLSRRFIEYSVNPKINALFRSERFDLLNPLLEWTPNSGVNLSDLMDGIRSQHERDREIARIAVNQIEPIVLENFVLADLSSVIRYLDLSPKSLGNYTGRVANSLINKYNKVAIVFADIGTGIKASLRDAYSRNYLNLFRTFCKAEGHPSAFSISISYLEFDDFFDYIKKIDENFSIQEMTTPPIIISHNKKSPDEEMLNKMAIYNEFAGLKQPLAYIDMYLIGKDLKTVKTDWGYRYTWGSLTITSPNRIRPGAHLILRPSISSTYSRKCRLYIEEVATR
jgi:single-stranded-DNA-specific exonuclease